MTEKPGPDAGRAPAGGPLVASGPASVVIGGDNNAPVTTSVTQHIRQVLLLGRPAPPTLVEAAAHLAGEVGAHWSAEAVSLGIGAGDRLPVRWVAARTGLCASVTQARGWMAERLPAVVEKHAGGWAAADPDLAGVDHELVNVWMTRSPTRRLVVLGEAGSGKSELVIRALVTLLRRRGEFDGAVPVLIPVVSWDSGRIESWLVNWLATNYRFLAAAAPGRRHSYARTLLHANKIALILDGFDELPPPRRAAFLEQLSLELEAHPEWAVMLTSRSVEYAEAALTAPAPPLGCATGVVLLAQPAGQVVEYLSRRSLTDDRWRPVAASVETGGRLAEVLGTPLMVMLADAVYNPAANPGPAELLSFGSAKEVEQHLLDSYVEARYRQERRWALPDVKRWFGFLAVTLNSRRNPVDLTWWDLRPVSHGRPGDRYVWAALPTIVAIVGWTVLSASTFNGWFYQDLGYGVAAGLRVAAAAAICYTAVLLVTEDNSAGLLAALGAYIAGTVSAGYDLAVAAAIAGGFAWRPLTARSLRWWHCLLFGGAVATIGAMIQGDDPSYDRAPGTPAWTLGFGSGFSDGWASRGDELVNGWLLSAVLAGALLAAAAFSVPRAAAGGKHPAPAAPRFGPAGYATATGVVVALVDSLANGARPDVTHGWLSGPADGLAVGVAVWCLARWVSPPPAQRPGTDARRQRARAMTTALLLALAAAALHGVGYAARTDIAHPWFRAAAEALGVGVVVWFAAYPREMTGPGRRPAGWVGPTASAVAVGAAGGYLDGTSAGWSRGAATGLSIGLLLLYARLRTRDGAAKDMSRHWIGRPVEAGILVTTVYGVAVGFAYGLTVGVVFGLAVQVSRDVSGRRLPSRRSGVSWPGAVGGTVLGTLVAVAAGFNGIAVAWLVPIGVTSGAAAAVAFGARGVAVPDDVVMSPGRLLRLDRLTFLAVVTIVAVALGLAVGTRSTAAGSSVSVGAVAAMSTVLTYGLTAGLLAASGQARYGTYLFWRLVYAARGELPWQLMKFLGRAHELGILRQNGANYQFRHQFLQDRLAHDRRRSSP